MSAMRFESITCPSEPVEASSSGVVAVTSTVSAMAPGSRVRFRMSRSPTRTSMPLRTTFLKPDSSAPTA